LKKIKLILALLFVIPLASNAYSVLTHEAIIDAMWDVSIKPLLKHKFPNVTEEQLKEAHAYAYGGAVTPDMGYYPFGSKLFTNLIHYVRSGDFVIAMLQEAETPDEYAFALGVLSHYNADNYGHPLGVNVSVPIIYPKVREKYGDLVTYEQDKASHVKTEFGFDVLQTARGNYAPEAYHDFIGFQVSQPVLEKAFLKTYGLTLEDVFHNFSLAVGTFRWTVKDMFPTITKTAWAMKKDEIMKKNPKATSSTFIFKMNRHSYYEEFGKERTKPGASAFLLSLFIKIIPKIGPLQALKFKTPNAQAEKLFVKSFDTVTVHYKIYANELGSKNFSLPDIDFDTGKKTAPGEYQLADENYGTLLLMLQQENFKNVTASLKQNILTFYNLLDSTDQKETKVLKDITNAINQLKNYQPVAINN
jgi:hypothetical protein